MKRIIQNTFIILNSAEKRKLGILIFLNLLISIIDIASLALLVLLISFYTQGALHIRLPVQFQWLFEKKSVLPISIFLILFILKSMMGYWVLDVQYSYVYKVSSRISRDNLLKYLKGNYEDYTHIDSSVHVRQILDQPIQFGHYILSGIQQIITEGLLCLFTVTVVLFFNAGLFLLLALVLLPPLAIIAWFTKRKLKQARAHAKTTGEMSLQLLHEALAGYIESNIYDKSAFFAQRYSNYQERMAKYLADIQITQGAPARLIEAFAVLGLFALILANKFLGGLATVEIVNIGAFMAAAYKVIPGIVKISNISGQIKTHEYTADDIIKNKNAGNEGADGPAKNITSVKFSRVGYRSQHHEILNSFDLDISAGDFAGITGPSGQGKTTLINLLLGFLTEASGEILINGHVVNAPERQNCRAGIAYVQQRPFLIHDTILTNITLGDENYDRRKLSEVIKAVCLDEWIAQFPEGINSVIAESGKNISGGQRQRIAIARALYSGRSLIILDEPFSELDAASEKHILAYLQMLSQNGKMIVMVTHKKENLLYCNKIYTIGGR